MLSRSLNSIANKASEHHSVSKRLSNAKGQTMHRDGLRRMYILYFFNSLSEGDLAVKLKSQTALLSEH